MGEVIRLPGERAAITTDAYFGGCPHCGANDGYMNVEREHWCVCDKHKTKWRIGSNLFSDWKDEDPAVWTQNEYRLGGYMVVKPIYESSTMDSPDAP